ncbi:MAG: glycosyltransferase [Flavobacterium sp.]|nr:glycosyltransferase [Flavobacterium sp.]
MSLFWKESPLFLDMALESLFLQTVQPTEIIIVTEGILTDALKAVLQKWENKFAESDFKVVDAKDTKGLPGCLNVGLKLAIGDYIIRVDTDDYCYKHRIETQLAFFYNHPDIVLISAVMEEYDTSLQHLLGMRKVPNNHNDILNYAKWRNPFNHPSVAYKREVAVSLNGYPLVNANEDYAFFTNFLVNKFITANIDEVLVKARTGKEFASRRSGKKYLKGELEALAYIYKIGFFSVPLYYFHIVSKICVRLLPSYFVKNIYKNILR